MTAAEAQPDQRARQAAATRALDELEPGTDIGLGSGRAVWAVLDAMTARWGDEIPFRIATASARTQELAVSAGVEVLEFTGQELAVVVDGADEVDPQLGLIKGGGGALLREKLLARAGRRLVIVAETPKRVERLGATHRLPVDVMPYGWEATARAVGKVVDDPVLRRTAEGAVYATTDAHAILDCVLPPDRDLVELGRALKAITGVTEHGLFLGMTQLVLLGRDDGRVESLTPDAAGADR